MAMIGKVLRMRHRDNKSVREIARATSLSRNTVRKYLRRGKAEAPRYAQMLPDLPRLVHDYLRQRPHDSRAELQELLAAQKRTNRLLQSIIYGGLGFVLGLLAMQLLVRLRFF